MTKKRTYSTQSVESLCVETLVPGLEAGCIVAVDVAKTKFVAAIATGTGDVVKLFRFEHPRQTPRFLEIVQELRAAVSPGGLSVAMEPTGTYGDAIRHQLQAADVPVLMVAPKKTHDSRALFDDVQSMHDPKSAVHIAKLAAMQLATAWTPPSQHRVRQRALVELRAHQSELREKCFGRLEALLARHWPEFGEHLDIRRQQTALVLLAEYPSPGRVGAAPDDAAALLRKASRSHFSAVVVADIVDAARRSLGVPATPEEEQLLVTLASQARETEQRIAALDGQMEELGKEDEVFRHLAAWMGTYTATVIVTRCDPRQYLKARQLEKACGLNLREKSSGEDRRDKIRVRITKRGPALVRKLLYLFALRAIHKYPEVRAWYMRRRSYKGGDKQSAVTAVMRKLVRALFHVAKGNAFDPAALFDLRRLEVPGREPAGATLLRRDASSVTPLGVVA